MHEKQRRRDCSLYVSGDDREELIHRLHDHFGGELDDQHLTVADHRMSVFRNSLRWRTEPETHDFVSWRTIVEIEPEPLIDDSTVLRVVTDAVRLVRSLDRQVIAVCDFEDELTEVPT